MLTFFKANKAVGLLVAILAFVIIIGTIMSLINSFGDEARDSGVQTERALTQGKVIENVQKAKVAADGVRRDGVPNVDCLRDSRTPANC